MRRSLACFADYGVYFDHILPPDVEPAERAAAPVPPKCGWGLLRACWPPRLVTVELVNGLINTSPTVPAYSAGEARGVTSAAASMITMPTSGITFHGYPLEPARPV